METKYPALKRPRRKLCYVTEKESAPKQWGGVLTLEDVDKMFDDIDSSTPDLHPPSPLLQSSDTETNQSETTISPAPQEKQSMEKLQEDQNVLNNPGPDGDVPPPAMQSPSSKLDNDLDIPFKGHGPVKTSSPIEPNMGVVCVEVQHNEKDEIVSPILFNCEDEVAEVGEEPNTAPVPTEKPSLNGEITVGVSTILLISSSHDGELESPRCRVVLTKLSSLKEMAEASCGDKNTKLPVAEVSQEPEPPASRKNLEAAQRQPAAERPSRAGKDMNAFLEKLKQTVQSRPRRTRKSPVKAPPVPPPPPLPLPHEPEDDFLILEDDGSFQFSIPSKNTTSRRRRLSKTSNTEKESSPDKKTDDRPQESPQERRELEKAISKQGGRAVNQKVKKKKENEKNRDVITPDVKDDLHNHLDPPAGNLFDDQKLNEKKQLKKVPSKEKDEVEDQPKDIADEVTEKKKLLHKTETKAHKTPTKRKTSKANKKSTKTIKANRLKETTEQIQEPDAVKEVTQVDAVQEQSQEQSSKEPPETEDLGSFTEREIIKAPEAVGKTERKKHPAVSGGSSSEDSQVLAKRQRKQTGQWWLSCPHSTEEPEILQPTVKKSKQNSKEPSTAVLSPGKAKKDKVYKKKNQKQPVTLSTEHTNKEKKTKQTRKRNAREAKPEEIKATDELFDTGESGQEQQQIFDQNLEQERSSPLVFTHRDHSLNLGSQIFQRVYHHSSSEKVSTTSAAPVSPRQPKEQLGGTEAGKRRRSNPPGNWWKTNVLDDSERNASQPKQLKRKGAKPQQQRKKQSKKRNAAGLGVPKNGNVAIPSKPAGGAPTSPLNLLSAPKTVKRSLATFKDIFTSVIETPTVVSNRGPHQSNRCNITSDPAGEGSSKTHRKTDSNVFGGDGDGPRSTQHNFETPQGGECQSESILKVLRSGPSSMIELEQHEDNDGMILPSSRVSAVLSASDLCAPPLIPLTLHPKDKTNLTEWFQSLWSTTSDDGVAISPDQFDWYSYQDRALGFQVDLNSGSICSGKILLGSHMKKPLWVDHSATTVFNLLTSSVSVTIDGCVSRYRPGQAFMVECGRAYSIQNTNAQPAVLHFTRILAENSD